MGNDKKNIISKEGLASGDRLAKKDGLAIKDGLSITMREQEVLKLIADGCSNKEIAKRLGISVRTVETHRRNITEKLNIKTVAGLIKYSIANNLTKIK